MLFNLEEIKKDPEVVTGLSLRRYKKALDAFQGTELAFVTLSAWCHLGLSQPLLARLMATQQPNISRIIKNNQEAFAIAWRESEGTEPVRRFREIRQFDDLLKAFPDVRSFLSDAAAPIAA